MLKFDMIAKVVIFIQSKETDKSLINLNKKHIYTFLHKKSVVKNFKQ